MRRTDIWAGCLLAAACMATLLGIIPYQTSPAQSETNMSPAMMPSVAVVVILLLAVLLVVSRLVVRPHAGQEAHEEFGTEARGFGREEALELASWTAAASVTMALLMTVGFAIAGAVLLAAAMLYMGQRNVWIVGVTALAAPVSISLIAWYAFSVQMP